MVEAEQSRVALIWKYFAFLGRYGHQPMVTIQHLTILELQEFSNEVSNLLSDENAINQMETDGV